jgi:hypothetical protein
MCIWCIKIGIALVLHFYIFFHQVQNIKDESNQTHHADVTTEEVEAREKIYICP